MPPIWGRWPIVAFFDAFERAMRTVARSASRTARRGEIVVQTYRGYGTEERIFLIGRVLREPLGRPAERLAADREEPGFWHNLRIIWRMMRAWGIEGGRLSASFDGVERVIETDGDGYFHLDLALTSPPPADRLWHKIAIRLEAPVTLDVEGDVFVPGRKAAFGVISDIDDTVMYTGVANKLMMMWRLFVEGAESRTAFPGMAPFLRALHQGQERGDANPMLYVSRAPWAIYGVLDRFFNLHDIPVGPILFLREWGLTLQHPLPRRGRGHKLGLIRQIIAHHDGLPFVLIGDSGQRDPEIYAEIVRHFPGRILAVYIRDVSDDPKRDRTIGRMAADLAEVGSSLVLAADTTIMARDAAERGLIAEAALAEIDAEIRSLP